MVRKTKFFSDFEDLGLRVVKADKVDKVSRTGGLVNNVTAVHEAPHVVEHCLEGTGVLVYLRRFIICDSDDSWR